MKVPQVIAPLDEDLEAKERNSARWKAWHESNRSTYNVKRRDEARKKAMEKKIERHRIVHEQDDDNVKDRYWTRTYKASESKPRHTGWDLAVSTAKREAGIPDDCGCGSANPH